MEELRVLGGRSKAFEYRYSFCIDDGNIPRWDYPFPHDETAHTRFVFETRTNFAVKLLSDDDDPEKKKVTITIDSEMFPTQFSEDRDRDYEGLEMSIGRRFQDYSMPDEEIHEFVGKAVAFAKKESEQSRAGHAEEDGPLLAVVVINLEVCTVQREGESIGVVVERAIRPRNLYPLNLCPWHCYSRPTGIDEEGDMKDDLHALGFSLMLYLRDGLHRFRLGEGDDVDDDDDKSDCSICLRNPTVGDEVSSLECGHVFHHHCIVRWFVHHNTCPVCRRQAHDFVPN